MIDDGPQWGVCLPCFLGRHEDCVRPFCECWFSEACWTRIAPPGAEPTPEVP